MTKQTNPVRTNIASVSESVASGTPRRRKTTGKVSGAAAQAGSVPQPTAGKAATARKREQGQANPGVGRGERMTKQERVLTLLNRAEGADIEEIMVATGWQQHSVRGFFAGTIKKKLGFNLVSTRDGTEPRRYRIETSGKKAVAR